MTAQPAVPANPRPSPLPASFEEWRSFALDLSPMLGFAFFHEPHQAALAPLSLEVVLLWAYVYLRLLVYGGWRGFSALRSAWLDQRRQGWPTHAGDWAVLVFAGGFFGSIAMITVVSLYAMVLTVNLLPGVLLLSSIVAAATGNPDANLWSFIASWTTGETTAVAGIVAVSARRFIGRTSRFLRSGEYRTDGWEWVVLGLRRWPTPEVIHLLTPALFLAILVPFLFATRAGPWLLFPAKAFIELWVERLVRPAR
jgi:hypothetical protein